MMICIVYWINAIISPTCICPSLTPCAPLHTISMVIPFMISIIIGIINVMARFTNKLVLVRSLFALSNRSSSCFSVLNARIAGSPVRISRVTRFSLSTRFCRILNFGIATINNTATTITIRITPSTMIHDMLTFVWRTLKIPPIAMIGAYITILRSITASIWICWISLVLLVISDAVENLSNSALENPTTFLNTFPLRSRPVLAATLEARSPTVTLASIPRNASASILPPVVKIYLFWILSVFTPRTL